MKRLLAALLLLPLAAQAQVYRCDVDGRTIFQDSPCGENSTRVSQDSLTTYQPPAAHTRPLRSRSRSNTKPQSEMAASDGLTYLERINKRNNIVKARGRGQLAVGMSETDTISILGYPNNYASQRLKRDECKQFRWYNPRFSSGHHYALICDGKVIKHNLIDR
ncbi:DUF4124 domain-containing protein [Halomonas korlensis]|uniref:DUF4124 domain-containing protein n=1 Tax=Halomonas korlensis TaxID=463301 RepID=A0A1I7I8T9_9GAMM|nr:DUF4124 domain-containing protein [Halomonas korlensis]SFU69206.1 protein of unknown function [Halomonas korlensis]